MNVLGIDIGGSAVKGAPVDLKTGKLLAERHRVETPERITPQRMARVVAELAKHFAWRGPVGVGFPGVVHGSTVKTSANLHPRFIDCDLGKLLARTTRCPVKLINDADAAGLAEMRYGAGRGQQGPVLLLTLGTGVGSALFHRGVLYPNSEFGHLPFRGGDAEKRVAAAVRKSAGLSWKEWSEQLNDYLGILEKMLWPDLIIVGGGISAKSEKFFPYLQTQARLVAAHLQNGAGIIGAALHGLPGED